MNDVLWYWGIGMTVGFSGMLGAMCAFTVFSILVPRHSNTDKHNIAALEELKFRNALTIDTIEQLRDIAKAIRHDDSRWVHRIIASLEDCVEDQRNGNDVLASASWDEVVKIWNEK